MTFVGQNSHYSSDPEHNRTFQVCSSSLDKPGPPDDPKARFVEDTGLFSSEVGLVGFLS